MFNLEQAIAEWRRHMVAGGFKTLVLLEELEGHLREEIGTLMSEGETEDKAFQIAVSRLGSPGSVRKEFNKVKLPGGDPARVGSVILICAVGLLAVFELRRMLIGQSKVFYDAHMFSLTVGYFAVLMTGGFGIFYICTSSAQPLHPAREENLRRAMLLFSCLSIGFVIAGFLMGMIWSKQNRGSYFPGDPRAVGCGYLIIWLLASCALQLFRRASFRVLVLLSVGGSLLVSLAWFGAGLLISASDIWSYWLLHILLGVHLFFLLIGTLREPKGADA